MTEEEIEYIKEIYRGIKLLKYKKSYEYILKDFMRKGHSFRVSKVILKESLILYYFNMEKELTQAYNEVERITL